MTQQTHSWAVRQDLQAQHYTGVCTLVCKTAGTCNRKLTKCVLAKLMVSVEPTPVHLVHLDKLPQCVQRDNPRQDQDDDASRPAQVGHG